MRSKPFGQQYIFGLCVVAEPQLGGILCL